jgi:hypothetical protein
MAEFVPDPGTDTCEIADCDRDVAVRLDVPWEGLRDVCTAHARSWAQKEGVVAMPIEEAEDQWPRGSGRDS